MNIKCQHIEELYALFKKDLLPAISNGEAIAFECLQKARIETNGNSLPIIFNLNSLYTAIWLWGKAYGVYLPGNSNFDKEFRYFWSLLTNPWPTKELEEIGLLITPVKTTGAKVVHTYQLTNT
jgi:hypothetical protein